VLLHYLVKYKCKKDEQSWTASVLVNKIHFQPEMQWMICTMLDFVMSISLDIWHIEQYVCFWPLWSSKPAILFTMIMFSSVRVCFSLLVSCFWSVLHVFLSQISVNNIPIFSEILQVFSENCIFEPVQVPYQSLVFIAKWHIMSPVYRQCIKNYCLWQYRLFLRLKAAESSYCFQRVLAIAILSVCLSVCPSVHHTGGSVKNSAS